jgi:hypothetical protein
MRQANIEVLSNTICKKMKGLADQDIYYNKHAGEWPTCKGRNGIF